MASDRPSDGDESSPITPGSNEEVILVEMAAEEIPLRVWPHLPEALPAHYAWALAAPGIRLVNMLLLDAELPPLAALDRETATEVRRQIIELTRHQMAVEAISYGRLPAKWDEREDDWMVRPDEYLRWRRRDPVWRYKGSVWPSPGFQRVGIDIADDHNLYGRYPAKASRRSRRHLGHWEEVLGATLACLATWPDLCRTKTTDRFNLAALIRLVEDKSPLFWPEELPPPLGKDAIEKRIRFWLQKTRQKGDQ